MCRHILIVAAFFIGLAVTESSSRADSSAPIAEEIRLPSFKSATAISDVPFVDVLVTKSNLVLLAGRTSLWRWHLSDNKLQRVELLSDNTKGEQFRCLGTDGLADYVASDDSLYQIIWHPRRVLKFAVIQSSRTLGFAGSGDNYWLVQSNRLLRIDRYGRSLILRQKFQKPDQSTALIYEPTQKMGWYASRESIYRLAVDESNSEPKRLAKLKEGILSLQYSLGELLIQTKHAVIRMSTDGKIIKTIPIEGHRQLVAMSINDDAHLYLFNDQVLEVYLPKAHRGITTRLPVSTDGHISHLSHLGGTIAMIADGQPRLFRLPVGPMEAK